jgi:hypothetical protein
MRLLQPTDDAWSKVSPCRSGPDLSVWVTALPLSLRRELSFHINLILTVFVVTSLAISPSFTLLWLPPIITTAVTALIMARLCSQKVFAVFFYACLYVPYYGLQTYIVLISHVLEVFKVTRRGHPLLYASHMSSHMSSQDDRISSLPYIPLCLTYLTCRNQSRCTSGR